jgi:O-antigen chain-terminating methyltransferase
MSGVDVIEIMRQVKEQANKQRQKFALSSAASPRRNRQVAEDLSFLQSSQDLSQVRYSSHRKVVGDIILMAKRVLQQLLTPILERQSAYNAVNVRLMASLSERVERMEERIATTLETLRAEESAFLDALRETITGQLEVLAQQQTTSLHAVQQEVASLSREHRARERHLTRLLDEVRTYLADPLPQDQHPVLAPQERRRVDGFFAVFDEAFRGSRTAIKEQLRVYVPYLKEAKIGTGNNPIVDLGCGRGEWLELLQEEGLHGKGVERNRVLVQECCQAGLDVAEGDILTYLCALPDRSLGGVTGFHIVEHLAFAVLLELFDEIVRVLQPGGVVIFETPNPQNVLVSSLEFYNDPDHRAPLPSTLLKFVAEVNGLQHIRLLPLHPFPEVYKVHEAGLEVAERFNELFYGPQDYALIGWKP